MKPLAVRVISAVIGVGVIALLAYWFTTRGLTALNFVVMTAVIVEYSRLIFPNSDHVLCWLFRISALSLAAVTVFAHDFTAVVFGILVIVLASSALLTHRSDEELQPILNRIALMVLGLVYCGLFGGLITSLLELPQGVTWYLGYLGIVFAGDTFAYFVGKAVGESKFMPTISPKKTIAGAWGGLLGSCMAAAVLQAFFLPFIPLYMLVLSAVFTAGFAQLGDIFESLVKRVAQVKDSGHLMPGHGGLLDRVDGVFFAAPIFFLAASYFSSVY